MEPTIFAGDHVFVLRPVFSGAVRRGDVIAILYPVDQKQTFLKRVVGMPGDRIKVVNKNLWINGKQVSEPYIEHNTEYMDAYRDNFPTAEPQMEIALHAMGMLKQNVVKGEVVVPPGNYFVLGDNRDQSLDSRYWGFASDADLLGRPLFILGKGKSTYFRYSLAE
jgi:signal peptidase I